MSREGSMEELWKDLSIGQRSWLIIEHNGVCKEVELISTHKVGDKLPDGITEDLVPNSWLIPGTLTLRNFDGERKEKREKEFATVLRSYGSFSALYEEALEPDSCLDFSSIRLEKESLFDKLVSMFREELNS